MPNYLVIDTYLSIVRKKNTSRVSKFILLGALSEERDVNNLVKLFLHHLYVGSLFGNGRLL